MCIFCGFFKESQEINLVVFTADEIIIYFEWYAIIGKARTYVQDIPRKIFAPCARVKTQLSLRYDMKYLVSSNLPLIFRVVPAVSLRGNFPDFFAASQLVYSSSVSFPTYDYFKRCRIRKFKKMSRH